MPNEQIKLVIFDLDGTLVDAYQAVSSSLNHALSVMNIPAIDDEHVKRNVGWGETKLLRNFVPQDKLQEALRIYRESHKKTLRQGVQFLPGAKKLLDRLKKKGCVMAIGSNRPSPFTDIILEELKIQDYFSSVICADMVEHGKPAGDILLEIMKELDFKPKEALYVGDMSIDAQAGHASGVKTIIVLSGSSCREEVEAANPYCIVEDLTEIEKVI